MDLIKKIQSTVLTILFIAYHISLLSVADSKRNTNCSPGNFRNKLGRCEKCPVGQYSDVYSSSCYNCPPNMYTKYRGVHAEHLCIPCGNNEVFDRKQQKCRKCRQGYLPSSDEKCIRCKPGEYYISGYCSKCDDSSISVHYNANSCTRCPIGSTSNSENTKCIVPKCPQGKQWDQFDYWSTNKCKSCKENSFKSKSNQACQPCKGRTAVSKPNKNKCKQCGPGTFLYNSMSVKAANYEENGKECKKCPYGTTTKGYGKLICREKNSKRCPRGTFEDKDGDCDYCDYGFFYNKKENKCNKCPRGHVSKGKLRTKCMSCGPNSIIHPEDLSRCDCRPGYVWERKQKRCVPCGEGTFYFRTDKYRATCLPCTQAETAKTRGRMYSKKGALKCKTCPPGYNSLSSNGKWCARNVKCPKGMVISGSNQQFPGYKICVSAITGCPNHLRPVVRGNFYILCANSRGKIVCPRGYHLDSNAWGCYPNN